MLTSLALIFLLGLLLGSIFQRLKLPSLIGLLLTGIILGPYVLNLLDDSILSISADLRQLALIIILMRAGLSLNIGDLKKVGRPAILMCFIPACFEIIGTILLAPPLLNISYLDAAIMGSVIAAVSPAVVVPRMLKLMNEGYNHKNIPQLIMAGASVDDVFVIVLFTSFTSLAIGDSFSLVNFINIPISILTGVLIGCSIGYLLVLFFKRCHLRDSAKVVILLSISFLLVALEKKLEFIFPISGLLAVMAMGAMIFNKYFVLSERLSNKFAKLWVGAEILLFVLVGATIDVTYALSAGFLCILLIFGVLIFRMTGVFICLLKTELSLKERLFCMIAYTPKATVQAAIGTLPLTMGLECGQIVLTVAVLSILITAPLGALGIDLTYRRFLRAPLNSNLLK